MSSNEIIVHSPKIPSAGVLSKNLWNDDSIHILLSEYKKLKEAYSIKRSSSMPKKGWEIIKRKLHAAGYKEIRHQHVVKKFAALKLHYKELREGLPVKQRIYGFVDILSEILDDDPYIAFAKPTKRMKEKRLIENKALTYANFIMLELAVPHSDEKVTEIIHSGNVEKLSDAQLVDASILLTDEPAPAPQVEENPKKQKKLSKVKREAVQNVDNDKPGMPSWISYLVELLKKEEQQRTDQLWRLHEDICQAEKVKVDMLERMVSCLTSAPSSTVGEKHRPHTSSENAITRIVIPEQKIVVPDKSRNIIIVDEEGSIYLKPSDLFKRKGERVEYTLANQMIKPSGNLELIEAESVGDAPQIQLQLIGEGDEIIIENCDDSEIYKVEPVYEDELEQSDVIQHVEIIEEQEEEVISLDEHQMDTIEFIESTEQAVE